MTGVAEQPRASKGSPRRRPLKISYVEAGDEYSSGRKPLKEVGRSTRSSGIARTRVYPEGGRAMVNGDDVGADGKKRRSKKNLRINAAHDESNAEASSPTTPSTLRGSKDLRSPGQKKTPRTKKGNDAQALPDFITQTDANGNATTPRSAAAIQGARVLHPSGPQPHLHVGKNGVLVEDDEKEGSGMDPCEALVDGFRMMCCCLMPEESDEKGRIRQGGTQDTADERVDKIRLLGPHHPDDAGKKCLVLDLDETLVHSSFRAVPGADFVIPVQIEDVVHFVYVAKRPGVDEFLIEMAKHYEIVIYTASLNKYADPLLDLLDPHNTIRSRLFRESCVYYEGNYVKDLSLLDRDLSQVIIVDNSPSSYIFHPENAIDCSSFIDDPNDRELDQIGAFLAGIKQKQDIRGVAPQWRDWPVIEEDEEEM